MGQENSFNNLSEEEKKRYQKIEIDRMFDLAERSVMEYISLHLKLKPEELFIDYSTLSIESKPIIIQPTNENGTYLSFSLKIVPYDYKLEISEDIKECEKVNYTLGFIYHSIINIHAAILSKNINENYIKLVDNSSFHFEMDDEKLSLYPMYIYPQRRAHLILTKAEKELADALNKIGNDTSIQITEDIMKNIEAMRAQYLNIVQLLKSNQFDIDTANKAEIEINKSFEKNQRIGIVLEKLSKEQLPPNYIC
jgi:hypothetical protein